MRILSDAERAASLRETLKTKPRDDVWLFGYGSLIWNPTVEHVERRVAKVLDAAGRRQQGHSYAAAQSLFVRAQNASGRRGRCDRGGSVGRR